MCVCVFVKTQVWDVRAEAPSCWPVSLPRAWLRADLVVQMDCRFSLQTYGMEVLAPLKKKEKIAESLS